MSDKDALEKAAAEYYQANPYYYGVTQAEIDERNTYAIKSAFKAGAEWQEYQCTNHGVDLMNERDQLKEKFIQQQLETVKIFEERDLWKSEYQNLCKFANDYEEQRDAWKKQAKALAKSAKHVLNNFTSQQEISESNGLRSVHLEYSRFVALAEALKAFEEFKKSGK